MSEEQKTLIARNAKLDTYALKRAGWKTEHPGGGLGAHPAVWIAPNGDRMGFASARETLQPQPDTSLRSPSPVSKDPIHDYILKADSQDLKEIMGAAGLDPVEEAAWVKKIIDKNLAAAPVPGDISSLVDALALTSEQHAYCGMTLSTHSDEFRQSEAIKESARQALLDAFSTLQRERDNEKELNASLDYAQKNLEKEIQSLEGQLSRLREAVDGSLKSFSEIAKCLAPIAEYYKVLDHLKLKDWLHSVGDKYLNKGMLHNVVAAHARALRAVNGEEE